MELGTEPGASYALTTPASRTLTVQLEDFPALALAALEALDVPASTRRAYRDWFSVFLSFWGACLDKRLTRDLALNFKRDLEHSGLKPSTIRLYLCACRRVFAELDARGYCRNIFLGIKSPKGARGHLRDALTDSEWVALRNTLSVEQNSLSGLRDFALANLLVRTGIRTVEAVRADAGDVGTRDTKRGPVKVLPIWGKGRADKDREVLLTPQAYGPLQAYLSARGAITDTAPLFASHGDRNPGGRLSTKSVSRIVREAMRRAAIKTVRLSAHSLRHYAASNAQRNGASLEAIQGLLGHEDKRTTENYIHRAARLEDGAEWYIRLPGDPQ